MIEDKRVLLVTQARTGSTRLPNKVLLKAAGKELLLHFIDRLLPSKFIDYIVVATTTNPKDIAIVDLVNGYDVKIKTFRGSEEDVLDRYYQSVVNLFPDFRDHEIIVRVTSDCPLIDYEVVDLHIQEFICSDVDYLSSRIEKRTWPHGMEAEVFTFGSLKRAWQNAKEQFEREHVTPYMYKTHPNKFRLRELPYSKDLSHIRLTIDYPEDLEFIKAIMESEEYHGCYMHLADIIGFINKNLFLLEINKERVDISL